MDEQVDEYMGIWTGGEREVKDGQIYRYVDMDEWTDRQMGEKQINGWMNGQIIWRETADR